MLERMGLGVKWQLWIRFCISTGRFSVLINGTPAGFLQSFQGLRQVDPLSSLLFILVMEALSRMLNRGVRRGLLESIEVGNGSRQVSFSHLLYADDTLVFCGVDMNQLRYLCCVLLCF